MADAEVVSRVVFPASSLVKIAGPRESSSTSSRKASPVPLPTKTEGF
jgi:hypothetical protein